MSENLAIVDVPKKLRSRVTNGRAVFVEGGDGRSAWTRRWRDLCAAHASDLGGEGHLSEAQKSLIKRAATLAIALEQMEATASAGGRLDIDLFGRTVGNLRRTLETLGLERRARDATPTLDSIVARHRNR